MQQKYGHPPDMHRTVGVHIFPAIACAPDVLQKYYIPLPELLAHLLGPDAVLHFAHVQRLQEHHAAEIWTPTRYAQNSGCPYFSRYRMRS